MDAALLGQAASILLWMIVPRARSARPGALRRPPHVPWSALGLAASTSALEAVVVTLGDQDPARGPRASSDEERGPAARSPKPLDPYRDLRHHLAAAAAVILAAAALGAFLLLR